MNLKRYLNKKLLINNWTIIIGVLLVLVVTLGAYYIGSHVAKPTNSLPPTGNPDNLTPPFISTQTATPDTPLVTPSSEIPASETPTATPSGADLINATITPQESSTTTPTPTLQPKDWARLVSSIPVDGTYYAPIDTFTKTWIIKNIGTTTWTKDYDLVFVSGTSMTKKLVFPLPVKVLPGKTIEISLKLTAPKKPGAYQGFWILSNKSGDTFGIGDKADQPLKNKITVLNVDPSNSYNFLLNYCHAEWWNGKGEAVKCPGEPTQISSFVFLSTQPTLENGPSDRPVLWVHTNNNLDGIISGRYPTYRVKNGDHFRARVGCIVGYPNCNVTFRLLYQLGGNPIKSLGTWKELYGGGITAIDVDLSSLAGQDVRFILRMTSTNNYPESAQGFWMRPRIVNIKPSPTPTASYTLTPTLTETAMPTETPTETAVPTETPTETAVPPELPTDTLTP